jgi:hypothetical protein
MACIARIFAPPWVCCSGPDYARPAGTPQAFHSVNMGVRVPISSLSPLTETVTSACGRLFGKVHAHVEPIHQWGSLYGQPPSELAGLACFVPARARGCPLAACSGAPREADGTGATPTQV